MTMTQRSLPEARQICPTTTNRLASEGALLVDVREKSELERLAFDVPNLTHIPLVELEARFQELPRDRELVMVCQGGGRSLKATYFLMYQGFEKVANMEGGIAKWASKGFPVKGDVSSLQATEQSAGGCCGGSASVAATSCCEPAKSGEAKCC
jgi:rhodanese-related sulfurtransferase